MGQFNHDKTDMLYLMRAAISAAVLLVVVAAGVPALAQSTQQIEEAAAKTIHRHDIQAALPREDSSEMRHWKLANIPNWVWLCVVILALIVVFYPMLDELMFWRPRHKEDWDGLPEDAALRAQQSLASVAANADELARQGRYMEAIHLLLLHALSVMRLRLRVQFPDSLTSREILRAANLASEGRAALQDMVSRVELSYFGEYPSAEEDYAACRASFDVFVHHLEADPAR